VRALLGAQRLQLVRVGFLGLERVPQQVQMDADDPVGPGTAELPGYGRSPVAALYPVPCVAQTRHQLGERHGHPLELPARLRRRPGQAEPGDAREYQVERVGGVAAVRARVSERADDIGELYDRAGPAVRHKQRGCVRFGRPEVGEVDVRTVDRGGELRPLVQLGLRGPPVVHVPPVVRELLEVVARDAVCPAHTRQFVGPAGAVETLVEIVQIALGYIDTERMDALVSPCRHSVHATSGYPQADHHVASTLITLREMRTGRRQ
jgi:hypothetical protein